MTAPPALWTAVTPAVRGSATPGRRATRQAVQLYDCNGTGAQKWTFDPATGVIHGQNGLCLDVRSSVSANGTVVQVYACNGSAAQQWRRGSGGFELAVASGKCLDVSQSQTANGTQIQLWDCNGTGAQTWEFWSP